MALLLTGQATVRRRIIVTFVQIILLLVAARAFNLWLNQKREAQVAALQAEYAEAVNEFIGMLRTFGDTAVVLGRRMQSEPDPPELNLRALRGEIRDSLGRLRAMAEQPLVQEMIDEAGESYEQLIAASDRMAEALAVSDSTEAPDSASPELPAQFVEVWDAGSEFMTAMLSLTEGASGTLDTEITEARERYGTLSLLNTLLHFIAFTLSFILLLRLARSITRPIHALTAGVEEISKGNLTASISVGTEDEFGRLAQCFEEMSGQLQRMLGEGKRVSDLALMVCAILDMDEVAKRLLNVVRQLTGGRVAVLTMEDPGDGRWLRYTSHGFDDIRRECVDTMTEGLEEAFAESHSVISVPLIAQERVVGSLEIRDHSVGADIERQTNLVSSLLVGVSMALRNAQFVDQLRSEKEKVADKANELESANRHLEEMQRFKSQFLAGMSHRLRTPLNSVIGCSDLILGGILGETTEKQREALGTVKRCGHSLLSVVDHLLNYSRLEAGEVDMLWGEFDLAEIIDDAIRRVDPNLTECEFQLRTEVSPEGLRWNSDRIKVRYILQYLLEQAACLPGGGEVMLSARRAEVEGGDQLEITVETQARELAAEKLDNMFEPFQGGEDRESAGAGLGLAIAKQLAELLGGELTATTEDGQGLTFRVRLPERTGE